MEKKSNGLIIVILIVIILALGGYIVLDKFILKKGGNQSPVTVIDDVKINLNALFQIGDTLERFDSAFNDPTTKYFGYIYHSKKITVNDFDKGAALYAATHKDMIGTNSPQLIAGGKVKNNFESMFGKAITYEAASIDAGDTYKMVYDPNSNFYFYTIPNSKNPYRSAYVIKNIKTTLNKDSIVVTRKIYYQDYIMPPGSTSITKADIYTSSGKQTKLGEIELKNGIISEKEVMSKFSSKLYNYEFTFKQNSEDNYTFYKVERTN